jgi:hypothetical protein
VDASLNDVISELLGTPQRWPSSCQHRIFWSWNQAHLCCIGT